MRLLVVAMTATGCGFELDLGAGVAFDAPEAIDSIDAIEIDAAVPCVASEFPRCAGEDVEICVAGVTTRMECGFGCVETLPVRCGDPVPSNSVSPDWIPAAPLAASLMVGPTQLLVADTDSGQIRICGGGDLRAAGTGVIAGIEFRRIDSGPNDHGVFALESLTVAAGATLRLIGDNPGTVIANGPIVIDGVLDLSGGGLSCNMTTACGMVGDRRCSGPGPGLGGGDTQDGAGVGRGTKGGTGSGNEHGGGGGGFGALGGKGGGSGGGAAGSVYGTATLTPLLAGSGGGGGASGGSTTQFGGGGGGGLQLTSMTSMQIGGAIIASGAGGGYGGNMFSHGGGGGGSGGAILLEATNLTITGAVTANGGGGGAGSAPPVSTSNGQDGRADAIAAFGGSGGASLVGGAGGSLPVPGGRRGFPDNSVSTDGSGGGGGGAGRIYMRARAGGITITGTVSPAPGFASDYLQ